MTNFSDLAPFFTNLYGAFGGRGKRDCGGSGFSSAKRELTAKAQAARSNDFLPIPDCTRSGAERKSNFFSRRSLHVGLGGCRAVGPGRGGGGELTGCPSAHAPRSAPQAGGPARPGRRRSGVLGAAGPVTTDKGLTRGDLAPNSARSDPGMHLNPRRGRRHQRSERPRAPGGAGLGPHALLGLPGRSSGARDAGWGPDPVPRG